MKKYKIFELILIVLFLTITNGCKNNAIISSESDTIYHENLLSSKIQASSNASEKLYETNTSGKGDLWTDNKLKVGFRTSGPETIWRAAFIRDIMAAAQNWNIELVLSDYAGGKDIDSVAMYSFIEQRVNVIGFNPSTTDSWEEIIGEIKEAGIPVILVDQEIYCEDESLWVTRVGNDWEKEGEMAGEWLIDYLKKEGRIDEKIKILEFSSMENPNNASQERGQGFKEAIKENINLEITSKEVYPDKTYSYEEMANILSETTDIDVLFCHNDDMALGAIQAIEEAGLVPGEDILIISVDGSDKILEYIAEGKVACSVECNPLMGDLFMEACVRLANGEEIEREIHPVDRVFDITNAQAELDARKENGYGY